jgi:dihydroxyacetone kinase-like protein
MIRDQHEVLSRLDSAVGDGDHGTTMLRAMESAENAIGALSSRDLKSLLNAVGWAILGIDGGATGPLFGSLFMGMAEAVGEDSLDAKALAAVFEAGLAAVQRQTKAQVGDKTMIDALVPGVQALRASADGGEGIAAAMQQAALSAETGAASTKALRARFGRARNLGDRSIGAQDAGATSVSLIFRGFAEAGA